MITQFAMCSVANHQTRLLSSVILLWFGLCYALVVQTAP